MHVGILAAIVANGLPVCPIFLAGRPEFRLPEPGLQNFADIGEQAIGIAVVTLGKPLYAHGKDNPTIQKLYVTALKVLLDKYPNTKLARLSTYDYAAYLRERDEYQQAVKAYDKVPENHPAYLSARYERLACLGAIWAQAPVEQKAVLATSLLRGVDDFNRLVSARLSRLSPARKKEIREDLANALLLNASVYIETTHQPRKAQKVIDEVTRRFSDLTELTPRITGLKIRIFQKQNKYDQAEAALKQYMRQAPTKAGPLALGVLQSLNTEIRDAAESGASPAQLAKRAQVAVNLADSIVMPWVRTQKHTPQKMIAYELMPAQSLLAAQEYKQALQRFNSIVKTEGKVATKNVDVLQGQAESLFGLKRYAQAGQIYAKLIRDRQNRPVPLYDRVYWNAQMRFYQMMDAQAGDKPNSDIYRGITPDGHAYLYYVLSRIWRPQSGVRENYSNRFYERNEGQIIEVAQKASQWIRQNPRAADQPCQRQTTGPQQLSERPVTAPSP